VEPDNDAKVVINERTGTVVMGEQVRISTIAIAHGNLSIVVRENVNVSQPLPFPMGRPWRRRAPRSMFRKMPIN
jgi:flagellar P-ring protein precursor FlgI